MPRKNSLKSGWYPVYEWECNDGEDGMSQAYALKDLPKPWCDLRLIKQNSMFFSGKIVNCESPIYAYVQPNGEWDESDIEFTPPKYMKRQLAKAFGKEA